MNCFENDHAQRVYIVLKYFFPIQLQQGTFKYALLTHPIFGSEFPYCGQMTFVRSPSDYHVISDVAISRDLMRIKRIGRNSESMSHRFSTLSRPAEQCLSFLAAESPSVHSYPPRGAFEYFSCAFNPLLYLNLPHQGPLRHLRRRHYRSHVSIH